MSEILLEKLKAEMKIEPEKVALSLENFIEIKQRHIPFSQIINFLLLDKIDREGSSYGY